MKTTFDITQKSIKNYVAIIQIKVDNSIYHVYPMKGSNAWKGCAYAYASPNGINKLENAKLYFINPGELKMALPGAKLLPNTNKYYRLYNDMTDNFNKFDVEYMDTSDMISEIATWHKYLDFTLVHINGTNTYAKVLPEEFDELVRNLHRSGRRDFKVAKITDTFQKIQFAHFDASVNKSFSLYGIDENEFGFEQYVHINRVTDTENHTPKNGYIVFCKSGSIERFMLVYDTASRSVLNEKQVIQLNQTYNSFVGKVARKRDLSIIKMVEFKNYRGSVNNKEYEKYAKKCTIYASFITDYECTDILSKAELKETTQVIDITHFIL